MTWRRNLPGNPSPRRDISDAEREPAPQGICDAAVRHHHVIRPSGSPCGPRRARGFALVAAIFIVVVLALLGIMMVTVGGMQRATATTAVRGTQAYFAARSGVEWGIFQAINNTAVTCSLDPATTTSAFNLAVNGLNGFTVSVACKYTQHRERSNTYNVYVITSTATSGNFGDIDYVSRVIQTTVTDAPAP